MPLMQRWKSLRENYSFAPFGAFSGTACFPRLAPWAVFFRRFAAKSASLFHSGWVFLVAHKTLEALHYPVRATVNLDYFEASRVQKAGDTNTGRGLSEDVQNDHENGRRTSPRHFGQGQNALIHRPGQRGGSVGRSW